VLPAPPTRGGTTQAHSSAWDSAESGGEHQSTRTPAHWAARLSRSWPLQLPPAVARQRAGQPRCAPSAAAGAAAACAQSAEPAMPGPELAERVLPAAGLQAGGAEVLPLPGQPGWRAVGAACTATRCAQG